MLWLKPVLTILASIVVTGGLSLLTYKTAFGKTNRLIRQSMIGLLLGLCLCAAMACRATINDSVICVCTALPLLSGFTFGPLSGIITAVVGAAYRLFIMAGEEAAFSQTADVIAILIACLIAAAALKHLYDKKRPSLVYAGLYAVFCEALRMTLVFLTHLDDVAAAYTYVSNTAILSIVINTLCVLLALLPDTILTREKKTANADADADVPRKARRPITQTFTVCLLLCIVFSFAASGFFTSFLQTKLSDLEVDNLLSMNVADAVNDVTTSVDRELLNLSKALAERINTNDISISMLSDTPRIAPDTSMGAYQKLIAFAKSSTLPFAAYVSCDGVIVLATTKAATGFDVSSVPALRDCISLAKSENDPVDGEPVGFVVDTFVTFPEENGGATYKFAAVSLQYRTGFLLTGFNTERYDESRSTVVAESALHRHIGQNGYLFVLDAATGDLVSCPDDTLTAENARYFYENLDRSGDGKVLPYADAAGVNYYYLLQEADGYLIIGCMPVAEATFYRDVSVFLSALMMTLIFFLLFTLVFLLLKDLIVDNVRKVNASLTKITDGDLTTRVDIRDNAEFNKLSDDINQTVGRLKELIAEAEKRIDVELQVAKSIQLSVLPSVSAAIKNRTDIDSCAVMYTAKEVGGDFYDFYFVDDTHLAVLIADVSGKGIPAAMFMMNAKSIIKDLTESGLSPAEIFTKANEKFCASNDAQMFITAWMGLIDLSTGVVKYVNAGHNPPLLRRGNEGFSYFKTRSNFVLAGLDCTVYREGEFTMAPGDELLLYTDGVTEATNGNKELFGEERLLNLLDSNDHPTAEDVCTAIKQALDAFVGDAPQFDDITMMSVKYKGNEQCTPCTK